MRTSCAIAFTVLVFSFLSFGQIPKSGNAFFGYSYSGGQVFTGGAAGVGMNGWEGSLEGKFLPWLGGVADLDWHYGSANTPCVVAPCTSPLVHQSGSRHSLLFGPRASVAIGKYSPFAQFLIGFTHQTDTETGISASDIGFSNSVGGGLDYKLVKSVAWRVQADWVHTNLFGGTHNNRRISTGLVFRF